MRTLIILCFTFFVSISFAQPRVVTFGNEEENSINQSTRQNALKLNIFEFISGDFSLYYERKLHEKISVEAGLGMTYVDIYGLIAYADILSPFDILIQPRMGFSYKISGRFYPIETFERVYVSPELKFRKYVWDRQIYQDFSPTQTTVSEERTYFIPRLSIGYAVSYNNNLYFDWTLGIGINSVSEIRYENETLELNHIVRNSRPRLHLGLKVGYIF